MPFEGKCKTLTLVGLFTHRENIIVPQFGFILQGGGRSSGAWRKSRTRVIISVRMGHDDSGINISLTIRQVLDGLPHATVECSGVSGALERQAALPVVHSPVMESGRGFSVYQIFLQKALQDHLLNTEKARDIRREESDF